ncbi:polysaccharide pyruvyl transferase family protein [Candidatus Roseilinea sp. NK_OTU-006]|jgi:colanic acid/amylovoran biosynthesis protein|uniref:polysaccharide pyruvyl transferase family protein n=1 Tax=Candidatus Roseilinea sp. NK_OTU-006 TaxID=2704250 RepID=UPI00145E9F74|nr:polysaccharide pyruvyl transferase family protein [Candidatus Roseilinea sp. NK_OTU-006]
MNILVINTHSLTNTGDAALTLEMLRQLREQFPGSRITLAMDDPASFDGDVHIISSILRWCKTTGGDGRSVWCTRNLLRFLPASLLSLAAFRLFGSRFFPGMSPEQRETVEAYFDAHVVISKPGGFLYTSGGLGMPFLLTIYTIAFAILCHKPHYMLPQSIGPVQRNWQRWLTRWALNRSRLTMIREPASANEMIAIGVARNRWIEVPDLAFAFPPAPAEIACAWLARQGVRCEADRPCIGVTAINWQAQNSAFNLQSQYEEALCEALSRFAASSRARLVFFPHAIGPTIEQDDRVVARRLASRLSGCDVTLIEEQAPPDVMKAAFGQMELFVGTRMHSNIFALSSGTPVVAIGYLHKTEGIMRMLDLASFVVDIRDLTADALLERVERAWRARAELRQSIRVAVAALAQSASHATALIADDLSRYG